MNAIPTLPISTTNNSKKGKQLCVLYLDSIERKEKKT